MSSNLQLNILDIQLRLKENLIHVQKDLKENIKKLIKMLLENLKKIRGYWQQKSSKSGNRVIKTIERKLRKSRVNLIKLKQLLKIGIKLEKNQSFDYLTRMIFIFHLILRFLSKITQAYKFKV